MHPIPAAVLLCVCCLSAVVLGPEARAGAWLRESGKGFVELKTVLRAPDGVLAAEYGIYGEFGVAPRLTLGVDANDNDAQSGHALVFARLPLGPGRTGRTVLALELAAGGHHLQRRWSGMTRATLSAGRGLSTRWGDGWINLDAGLELHRGLPDRAYKLDATIGLSSGPRLRPLLQLETTTVPGLPTIWAVTPSVMFDDRKGTTWVLGLERKSTGQSDTIGLKLAVWRRF